nr:probable LRR receptor-like serine/threonine-protein kinase At1g05700 [Tanacetum cinerariifolium]
MNIVQFWLIHMMPVFEGLSSLKKAFKALQEWAGDPCLPAPYSWEWIVCNNDPTPRNTGHRANGPYSGTGGTTSGDNFDNKAVVELDEKTDGRTIL